jgi:hypothetical protein
MGLPKTHTFCGKKYQLILEELDGVCAVDGENWLIAVRDLKTRVGLETLIHEMLHACDWSVAEEKVEQTAKDMARLLWRLGYRLRKQYAKL